MWQTRLARCHSCRLLTTTHRRQPDHQESNGLLNYRQALGKRRCKARHDIASEPIKAHKNYPILLDESSGANRVERRREQKRQRARNENVFPANFLFALYPIRRHSSIDELCCSGCLQVALTR